MSWKIFNTQRFFRKIRTEILFQGLKICNMFYAVAKGRTPGIFGSWADCEAQVKGYPGARYKKFNTVTEAQDFIETHGGNQSQKKKVSSSTRSNVTLPSQSITYNALTQKRPFSTSNQNDSDDGPSKPKKISTKTRRVSTDSNDSDDLSTIIIKQMDDIEKRLKGFEKGVDKIIKKSAISERKAIMIEPQSLGKGSSSNEFVTGSDGYVHVYTDGACSSNGKKGAKAGLGVYWGEGHPLNIGEPVSGRATNNCGEIQAATRAIQQAIDSGVSKLAINTDSKFLINSMTKWIHGWKRKGWKLKSGEPVKNEKDFKDLDRIQNKILIKWNYVEAHKGIHGNECADQLAKAGAAMYGE